jgi:multimeric flavodoxin WrbA
MKILTILGSPKKNGNTAGVLDLFEKLVSDGHDVERIHLPQLNVNGCLGCYACMRTPDEPGCVQKDDGIELLERIFEADAVVYASPLYAWDVTSWLSAAMERHLCFVSGMGTPDCKSLVSGKPMALLVTCGGPVEGNADLVQDRFDRFGGFAQSKVVGKYVVPGCTTPDALPDAATAVAKDMAEAILS